MSIQLTVVGLNRVGASIGLALKDNKLDIVRIGTDISTIAEQRALKMGAFDKVIHNLGAAVEDADIVVLCLPLERLRENLEGVAPLLKAGAVVLDTSPLAVSVAGWCEGLLDEERYLISFTPTLNPEFISETEDSLDQASADLFKNSLFAISASGVTHPGAIQLASDLAGMLGARAFFTDPHESDGLIALTDLLPKLSAAALLQAVTRQPGWREARKLGGHAFFAATEAVNQFDGLKEPGAAALLDAENAVRVLDNLIAELTSLRELVRNQDADELNKALSGAVEARQQWWRDRQKSNWEGLPEAPSIPSRREIWGRYIGLGRRKDKSSDKK